MSLGFCFLFFVFYLFIIFDGFLAKKTTVGRRVVLMNGLGSSSLALEQGRLDNLVLDVKLTLINMKYVNFFFLEIL